MANVPELLTVKEAEALTSLNLRTRIFANADGFSDRCVVRIGRSVRIRADALAAFIEERTGAEPFRYDWSTTPGRKPGGRA